MDSDIHDNLVVDYDKAGKVVRVNLYGIDFSAFREIAAEYKLQKVNLGMFAPA